MVKIFVLIAVSVALFCAYSITAQSQRPIPGRGGKSNPPQTHSPNNQQQAEPDKRGTEQFPLVVKTINPLKTKIEADEAQKQCDEKSSQDWWLIRFTGGLFIATVLIFGVAIWQGWQLKRSVDSIRNAERANLFVMVQHHDDMSHVKWFCEFTVVNAVRTAAILTNVNGSYEKIAPGDTIPNISPEGDHGITPDTMIIAGSPGIEDSKLFKAKKSQAFRGDHRLICVGRIQYKDIFGASHETNFCWEYMDERIEFQPINGPKCNYRT